MEAVILDDILVIFTLSIAILFLCSRLKIPGIVGFLITGMVAGPHALGLIDDPESVQALAEIGVVLLLFTIGMEFSFQHLLRIRRAVLIGGTLQVVLTVVAVAAAGTFFGLVPGQAVFFGFLLSLSSTAIVLSLLQERSEVESPHGRTTLGILIFQDLVIIPMMLLVPFLAGEGGEPGSGSVLVFLLTSAGLIAYVVVSAKWLVPKLLFHAARLRSREIFLLSIIVICLFTAWLTQSAGLSLSLGAFLAGLIVSESEYAHEALGTVLPFKDVFTSFFFVSVGMLLDLRFVVDHPWIVLLLALAVIMGKSVVAAGVTSLLGSSLRTSVLTGTALSQVGEFSFILSVVGVQYGLLSPWAEQVFLAVAVVTMIATPFTVGFSPRLAERSCRLPLPERVRTGSIREAPPDEPVLRDHIVIVGFGLSGRHVARAARAAKIPYVVVEMNPETVREERGRGEVIYYGNAARAAVLEQAGIDRAKALVVVISDPSATGRVVATARRANPHLQIIARTRYVSEMEDLFRLGADEVIPAEFETSVEIFTRILTTYLVPREEIERFTAEVRAGGYGFLRATAMQAPRLHDIGFFQPGAEVESLRVGEGAKVEGRSLADLDLRRRYGVTVLAVRRGATVLSTPSGETELMAGDVCVVIGPEEKVAGVDPLFRGEGV
ncbi:CPA2 family monovalent cation:H+ antiporter-2 [Methanofollis sp. W23]|uniref:cation:proton antiporter domain-containing protein n=1 Tax=Methanofollis sp. W23 TaxID=2817849 RepID=UPI001AE62D57|nr:cation:proton antiporter [Methanofollis sp. W23]MBP2147034.1 CPA2 family monovalent cation:H+ antiporter-2 [Methanofollis sp. W23]